ncbi:Piso0_005365 [Millerozyma farinosa CBS 7064]|uniref:non-specific serine/threonine protein kinase n=1 Tax=Pichia sorbitophila (strain ATCC MYA-4447 / BCRC 22081 / CBS 7064 / NBRC 10061 / NRRL Y-12695) TaxID=559304 RepID=G8Y4X2_PICSO|nr:Piso0_005365 [Millerozyma farinosa CBS 7064]
MLLINRTKHKNKASLHMHDPPNFQNQLEGDDVFQNVNVGGSSHSVNPDSIFASVPSDKTNNNGSSISVGQGDTSDPDVLGAPKQNSNKRSNSIFKLSSLFKKITPRKMSDKSKNYEKDGTVEPSNGHIVAGSANDAKSDANHPQFKAEKSTVNEPASSSANVNSSVEEISDKMPSSIEHNTLSPRINISSIHSSDRTSFSDTYTHTHEYDIANNLSGADSSSILNRASISHETNNYLQIRERCLSLTSKCVSLSNSEMTSRIDSDIYSVDNDYRAQYVIPDFHENSQTFTQPNVPSSHTQASGASGVNVIPTFNIGSSVSNLTYDSENDMGENDNYEDFNVHDETKRDFKNITESSINLDSITAANNYDGYYFNQGSNQVIDNADDCDDIMADLSETESEINYDPRQEENVCEYRIGGYHPVTKGEIYYSKRFPKREYVILRKLGWGHFSTVWLAKSRYNPNLQQPQNMFSRKVQSHKIDTNEYYVAMKFVKSSENYIEAAQDEIKLLKTLDDPLNCGKDLTSNNKQYFHQFKINEEGKPIGHPGYKHVMKLMDKLEFNGPNGRHICMVFEVLGESVLGLVYRYKNYHRLLKNAGSTNQQKLISSACGNITNDETSIGDGNHDETNGVSSIKSMDSYVQNTIAQVQEAVNPLLSSQYSCSDESSIHALQMSLLDNQDAVSSATESISLCSLTSSDSFLKLLAVSRTYGGLPLPLVKSITRQLLAGLDYMHHCGVIHTDLKPENILIEIRNVDQLIKYLEHEYISKCQKSKSNSSNRESSLHYNSDFNKDKASSRSKNSSTNNFNEKGVLQYGSYRRSRHSISARSRPVRCSKPLCTSIRTDLFKDFLQSNAPFMKDSKGKDIVSVSPKSKKSFMPGENLEHCEKNGQNGHPSLDGIRVEDDLISVKIADLGNATYSSYHFTNQIQTRQYRSPEIILQSKRWGASTDIWSLGCIIFELITGDYLFDPKSGSSFDRDDDHLAQMVELLGGFPPDDFLDDCRLSSKFIGRDENNEKYIKRINSLKYWRLFDVFADKYKMPPQDPNTRLISDFILKCLIFRLEDRYDANSLLKHPWLARHLDLSKVNTSDLEKLPKDHRDIPGFCSQSVA